MEFKLTSSQLNFYTKNIALDSTLWNQSVLEVFPKVYTYEQLNDAYNRLVKANDSIRVKFKETDDGIVTYVEDFEYEDYPLIKVDSEEDLMVKARDFLNSTMDFYGRLINCIIFQSPTTSGVMICAHHIVVDGFSGFVMSKQINEFLQNPDYIPSTEQYSEYIEKEEQHKKSKRFLRDKEFWKNQFNTNPVCDIFSVQNSKLDFSSSELMCPFPSALYGKIKEFCENNDISTASFFNTVYATYISRKYDVENFTIGVPVLNRTTQTELNTVGLYMHIIPLVVNLQTDSFLANAQRIQDLWMNIFRHQKFTQHDIREMLKEENKSINTLFDVIADVLEFESNDDYKIILPYSENLSIPLEFHLQCFNDEDRNLVICYRTSVFNEQEIQSMQTSIIALIEDAVENPHKNTCDLEMVSPAEKQKLLYDFNDTDAEYPRDKCVHTLFEGIAKEHADVRAIVASDKTLTYKELDEESNRIANSLIEKGVKAGDIVAFCLERKSYVFSAILGILKSGATYLPIDMNYPKDRKEYMLSDSKATFFITEDNINTLLVNTNNANPNIQISSNMGCYCIYTSGSTGKPKGALITHRNAVNLCYNNEYGMYSGVYASCQTICSMATLGFDMVIAETLVPLLNGMTIVFANENESKIPKFAKEMFERNQIDVFQSTPTKLQLFIEGGVSLSGVQKIIVGGEALESTFFKQLKESCEARIFNFYGPTETTVWSSFSEVTDAEDIHIGKPIANTQIYITDKHLNPTPMGVVGELCIAGDGVCVGYLNREDLTNEKFIDNPFGKVFLYQMDYL